MLCLHRYPTLAPPPTPHSWPTATATTPPQSWPTISATTATPLLPIRHSTPASCHRHRLHHRLFIAPPKRTGLWSPCRPGVNAWHRRMAVLTAVDRLITSPQPSSAAVAGTCQLATGRPCVNGACLDSQCYCNDGFGGKGCEMPGEFDCLHGVFYQGVFEVCMSWDCGNVRAVL